MKRRGRVTRWALLVRGIPGYFRYAYGFARRTGADPGEAVACAVGETWRAFLGFRWGPWDRRGR